MSRKVWWLSAFLYGVLGGLATPAEASSGPAFGGPVGATDIDNAYLPPPDTVFLGFANVLAFASHVYDYRGREAPATAKLDVQGLYLGYTYPFKLAGGVLASGVNPSYWNPSQIQLDKSLPSQHDEGWGDLYVDFLNWSSHIGPIFGEKSLPPNNGPPVPYGLTVKLEYSMIFPTAHYDPNRAVNIGNGTYFFIPNAAITYLTQPDRLGGGIQFNVHIFYNHQTTNWQTDYVNGDVIDTDFAIAQKVGRYTFGVSGTFASAIQADRIGPARLVAAGHGRRFQQFSLDPIFQAAIPEWHALFKIKSDNPIIVHNSLSVTNVVAVLVFAF